MQLSRADYRVRLELSFGKAEQKKGSNSFSQLNKNLNKQKNAQERRLKQLDDNNYLNLPAAVAAAAAQIDREATRSLPPRRTRREERSSRSVASASTSYSPSPLPLSFSGNSRAVRCSIAHFQLRNLLYTPSLHEAYVVHASRLVHWDSVTRERTVVLDLSGSNGNGMGMMDDDDDWRARLNLNLNAARGPPFVNSRLPLPPLPAPPAWSGAVAMLGTAAAGTRTERGGRGGGFQEQENRRTATVPQRVQVGTAAVGLGLAALGGFNGEVAVVPTRSFVSSSSFSSSSSSSRGSNSAAGGAGVGMRVTTSDNGITNGLEVSGGAGRGSSTLPRAPDFGEAGGGGGGKLSGLLSPSSSSAAATAATLYAANNDGFVRAFDASTWQRTLAVDCGWAVNFATAAPDGALLAAVGDDPAATLLDPRCCGSSSSSPSGGSSPARTKRSGVALLRGHLDYSFAAAWHPSGVLLATGNQDATARVWDLRNTREALHVLKSELGAVRSLRFSPDGALLAAAEPADFVKVYDCRGEGGKSAARLRPSRRFRRRRSPSSSRGGGGEETRDAGEEGEEGFSRAALLPPSSSGLGSNAPPPFVTCGACAGGGCPRCVDLALRHREGLARLRRRRQLVLEQRRQQQQQRQENRRRKRRASADDDDVEEEEPEEEAEEGGLPLLGESTDDDDNDGGGNDGEPEARSAAAAGNNSGGALPRGPFETVQAIDFFGEVAGISWSPCGSRLSVAVADATYSSLLQFDRI